MQTDFRLQRRRVLIDGRIVRPAPYRRVVVFHFRYDFQHGLGDEPPVVRRRGFDVRFDAVHDRVAGIVGPNYLRINGTNIRLLVTDPRGVFVCYSIGGSFRKYFSGLCPV